MIKLLKANLMRTIKSKTLWVIMALYVPFVILFPIVLKTQNPTLRGYGVIELIFSVNFGMSGFPAQGVLVAITSSIILGADFHNGTLRNKILLGQTRSNIYLANLLTAIITSISFNVVFLIAFFCVAMPLFGAFTYPASAILWILLDGLLMMTAYSAIMTFIVMTSKNSTASLIISFALLFVGMIVFQYCANILAEEKFVTVTTMNEMGEIVQEVVANSHYPKPTTRSFCTLILDLFPSGQSLQISRGEITHNWQMALYSLGMIAVTSGIGLWVFKKSDVK